MASLTPVYITPDTRKPTTRRVGVAIPFRATSSGKLARVSGEENDFKIISTALMSQDNDNPWQQGGDSIDRALFEADSPQARAVITRRVENVFADFERQHRYRLIPNTVLVRVTAEMIVFVEFKYHNLESDQIRDLAVPVGGV